MQWVRLAFEKCDNLLLLWWYHFSTDRTEKWNSLLHFRKFLMGAKFLMGGNTNCTMNHTCILQKSRGFHQCSVQSRSMYWFQCFWRVKHSQNACSHRGYGSPSNSWFFGSTPLTTPNDISIESTFLQDSQLWPTDRQTNPCDRPITIGRCLYS